MHVPEIPVGGCCPPILDDSHLHLELRGVTETLGVTLYVPHEVETVLQIVTADKTALKGYNTVTLI